MTPTLTRKQPTEKPPPPPTLEGLRPIGEHPEHLRLSERIQAEETKLATVEKELRALADKPYLKTDAISAEVARRVAGQEAAASPVRKQEDLAREAEILNLVLAELRQRLASLEVSLSARQRPIVAPLEAAADLAIEERLAALVDAVEAKARLHEQVQRLGFHVAALDGSIVRQMYRTVYVEQEKFRQRQHAAATVGQ